MRVFFLWQMALRAPLISDSSALGQSELQPAAPWKRGVGRMVCLFTSKLTAWWLRNRAMLNTAVD